MSQETATEEFNINFENFTVTEILKTWLHDVLLTKYEDTQESLNFSHRLIEERSLPTFIQDCKNVLEKGEVNPVHKLKYRFMLWRLCNLKQNSLEKINKDMEYLEENLPDITNYSEYLKFAFAIGLGTLNGLKATATKYGLTAFFAYKAIQAQEPQAQELYAALASINLATTTPPSPSIARLLSYLDFTIFEEILVRLYRKEDIKDILSFTKKNFLTFPRASLFFEGAGLFVVLPLEVMRMFNLEEISPKTFRYWKSIRKLRELLNIGGDGGN